LHYISQLFLQDFVSQYIPIYNQSPSSQEEKFFGICMDCRVVTNARYPDVLLASLLRAIGKSFK